MGAEAFLKFDRQAIANGRVWLLLTGNFVHLGVPHLLLNMAGLVLVGLLVWPNFNFLQWLIILCVSSIGVCIGLYLFDPGVSYYVGFSGTLHGLILAGTLADFKRFPRAAALLLLLVVGKLLWEQINGPMPGSEETVGGSVVVNSHLYGAITGGLVGGILLLLRLTSIAASKAESK